MGKGAARAWSDGRDERRTEEEKSGAVRERPCSTAAVINHPRCTCAARVARASSVAPRAPRPRSARSGDRREDARQGRRRRPATGREKNQGAPWRANAPARLRR